MRRTSTLPKLPLLCNSTGLSQNSAKPLSLCTCTWSGSSRSP